METTSQVRLTRLGTADQEPRWVHSVSDSVSGIACDPARGRAYVCTLQGACEALSLSDGRSLWRVEVPQSYCLAVAPEGDLLVLGHDNGDAPTVLDTATGEVLGNLPSSHGSTVWGLSFAADGRLAAWGNGNRIHLWRLRRLP